MPSGSSCGIFKKGEYRVTLITGLHDAMEYAEPSCRGNGSMPIVCTVAHWNSEALLLAGRVRPKVGAGKNRGGHDLHLRLHGARKVYDI